MKKLLLFIMMMGLSISVLVGCSNAGPKDTVKEFLTAIQKGDFEKAVTLVEDTGSGFDFSKITRSADGIDGKEMFDAVTKNYKFEEVAEVSNKDDKAEVKVKITSVDLTAAMEKTVGETLAAVVKDARSGNKAPSKQEVQQQVMKNFAKNLGDKDAKMITRDVTLNVKKDKDGNYKLVSDKNLGDAVLANVEELEGMFGNK
jgi:Domain of unknown function (DUF4878)